jgi:hypothetical protein
MVRGLLEDLGVDDNIKMSREVGAMGWIHPQSGDNWWALVDTAINTCVANMRKIFFD